MLVAYRSEEPTTAAMPVALARTEPAAVSEEVALPPERPFEFETIPNAATPVRAGARPLQIPSATAVVPLPPTRIPLPPQRNADAGAADGGLLDGGTVRLRIADIVGGASRADSVLAYAEEDRPAAQAALDAGHYVDAGLYAEKDDADTLRWVLSQSGEVSVVEIAGESGPLWRVRAGPFSERGDADAAAIMARNAGAAGAAVID
jgi:cell division protein FtsN